MSVLSLSVDNGALPVLLSEFGYFLVILGFSNLHRFIRPIDFNSGSNKGNNDPHPSDLITNQEFIKSTTDWRHKRCFVADVQLSPRLRGSFKSFRSLDAGSHCRRLLSLLQRLLSSPRHPKKLKHPSTFAALKLTVSVLHFISSIPGRFQVVSR